MKSKEYEYSCQSCFKLFLAYPSTRRGKTISCSKECAAKLRVISHSGSNNPNYKNGEHCSTSVSLCACGKVKDYRANKCSSCTKIYKPLEGYTRGTDGVVKAVVNSRSFVDAAKKCGESRSFVREVVKSKNLDISHFVICKDRPTPIKDVFKIKEKRDNAVVRRNLIEYELIEYKCAICKLEDFWNGENLTLELDHINGNRFDDRLENLRFLCPNCHSQTPTFRGRNINAANQERS